MTHKSVESWLEEIQDTRKWYPGIPQTRDEKIAEYIEQLEKRIAKLEKANSDLGWQVNPDRMGGGFTQQEIEDSKRGGPEGYY